MQRLAYESAAFKDPELPVIFHLDTTWPGRPFNIHWQDSLEMLYMVEGEAEVSSDTLRQVIRTGEIAVINSGHIHEIRALTPVTRYYCLLAERELCEQLGAPVGQVQFCLRVSDAMAREYFDRIVDEMLTRSAYYKPAVRADLGGLLVHLCRHWVERKEFDGERKDKRLDMVKAAISYIQLHLSEELSVEQITGRTVVDHINYTRCCYARRLLLSGKCNVSESAELSGFSNLSYFAKTYKKYMGELPSKVERREEP